MLHQPKQNHQLDIFVKNKQN